MATISLALSGILAILFGIIILVWPRALNIAVALYLLIFGLLQVFGGFEVF